MMTASVMEGLTTVRTNENYLNTMFETDTCKLTYIFSALKIFVNFHCRLCIVDIPHRKKKLFLNGVRLTKKTGISNTQRFEVEKKKVHEPEAFLGSLHVSMMELLLKKIING